MNNNLAEIISQRLSIPIRQISPTISLLEDGATIPFISRYRKEATGGLNEVEIGAIKENLERLTELEKRKETILSSIEEQGKLTAELRQKITDCYEPSILEDIYLPYKPKRRTRAMIAREKGLEPLAAVIMRQDGTDPEKLANKFLNDDVKDQKEAIDGAKDIIAEWVNESEKGRNAIRRIFSYEARISSKSIKNKETEGAKYSDYFDMEEPLKKIPSHRLLAIVRGEREGFLRLSISPDDDHAVEQLERIFIRGNSPSRPIVEDAVKDSYKRLLKPSMESEFMTSAKEKADTEAIKVFAENLRQLLLSPPLGQKRVLAIDPGFRTGCKVVCLDSQGNLLHNETIYPHPPQSQMSQAMSKISSLTEMYDIEAIAIGDGTAGRETEDMIKKIKFKNDLKVFMVSEDGASVYSASTTGREEFPDYDVTVRGAVSIGRRLIDPLSELVKIDPKSIGVGQYQHDVDQSQLKKSLDTVVESCVNSVGVNLNTASKHLLTYVSGLGASLAKNIVEYRTANGDFKSRNELKKVPRLGEKAFEQSAGFLRISDAANPLDNSAVHPESYHIVERMAKDKGVNVETLLSDEAVRKSIDIKRYVTDKVGLPTLTDIITELGKAGLDPRSNIKVFEFADVHTIDDLKVGMVLPGIVTNITAFGVFVDVGIKQDGLVHISQLADKYISNPADVVKLHQHVTVKVLDIDHVRNRISLTMKGIS